MNTNPPHFNPRGAKLQASHVTPGALFALCLDEPRRSLVGAGTDGFLYALNLADVKPAAVRTWRLHDNYVSGITRLDRQLISCGYDCKLNWTDLETGRCSRSVLAHEGWVRKLAPIADGKRLVTVGDDMRVKVWDDAGRAIHSLSGHSPKTPEGFLSALYALAVSADGKHAASGDRAGFVRVWDLERGMLAAEFRAPELYTFDGQKRARSIGGVRGLAFSPDGSRLAVSGIGAVTNVDGFVGPCRIELWDWQAARRVALGQDPYNAILNHVAFGPNDSWLVGAGGGDGGGAALVFWNHAAGSTPALVKSKGHLHDFVVDSTGRLYACGHQGFQVWSLGAA